MLYYLDTNIVIYAVEGQPPFQQRARNHIATLENAGHAFVISELTWTPQIVIFSGPAELRLKFVASYIGFCSKNGSMRTKQEKFSL